MSTTVYLVIFILVGSAIFPLVGYFFDYKDNRKMHLKGKKYQQEKGSEKSA